MKIYPVFCLRLSGAFFFIPERLFPVWIMTKEIGTKDLIEVFCPELLCAFCLDGRVHDHREPLVCIKLHPS